MGLILGRGACRSPFFFLYRESCSLWKAHPTAGLLMMEEGGREGCFFDGAGFDGIWERWRQDSVMSSNHRVKH